jgi:hypothetical protein
MCNWFFQFDCDIARLVRIDCTVLLENHMPPLIDTRFFSNNKTTNKHIRIERTSRAHRPSESRKCSLCLSLGPVDEATAGVCTSAACSSRPPARARCTAAAATHLSHLSRSTLLSCLCIEKVAIIYSIRLSIPLFLQRNAMQSEDQSKES